MVGIGGMILLFRRSLLSQMVMTALRRRRRKWKCRLRKPFATRASAELVEQLETRLAGTAG
jgi:hypothetical protein